MRMTRFAAALACGVLGAGCYIETNGPDDNNGGGGSSGTSGAGGGAAGECVSNQDCIDKNGGGEFYICRKDPAGNACVNVLSAECPKIFADVGDLRADPVVVGLLGAPSLVAPLLQAEEAFELARQDFRNALGGGPTRPTVWVSCDVDPTSPTALESATNHLLDEIGTPAVALIAPFRGWLTHLTERAAGRGTVVFSTQGFDVEPTAPAFFSNEPRQSDEARAQAAVVAVSEANARTEGQTGELRLVYLNPGTAFDAPAAKAFFDSVRFNGKSAQENGSNYRAISYGDPASPDFDATLAAAIIDAASFAPHLVACAGKGCDEAFLQLELAHPGAHYVLPADARTPALQAKLGDETLRKHVLGTLSGRSESDPLARTFDLRFAAVFPQSPPDRNTRYAYDASYALMYGLAAAGASPTGPSLDQALRKRLDPNGLAKNVGVEDIASALAHLAGGGSLDLRGVGGDLYFDASGAAAYEFQVWCVPATQSPSGFAETGLSYLSAGGLAGANTCF